MTLKTSKLIISFALLFSLSLSSLLLFTDIVNIGREHYDLSARALFFALLLIFQSRYFYLINFIKKNEVTHLAVSRLKHPILTDVLTGIFLFCILPLVLTFLNIYFDQPLTYWHLIFFILYIIGTCITLTSEYQRRKWKLNNKAHPQLYTGGLFKYAQHINYFGETISQPSLWFIATGVWWISLIAFLYQLYDFLFVHIPKQEKHLLEKYQDGFREASVKNKKLIPFVY